MKQFNELKNLDVIKLNKNQLYKLIDWREASEQNKNVVRDMRIVLDEGIIELGDTCVHFKENSNLSVTYTYFVGGEFVVNFEYNKLTKIVKSARIKDNKNHAIINHLKKLAKSDDYLTPLIQDVIMIHATISAYMLYYKPQIREVVLSNKQIPKHALKHLTRSKTPDELSVILRQTKTHYIFPDSDKITTKPLTKREIKALAWTVRGHQRTYKSGKVVYVKPYVKGREREAVKKKVYSISGL